MTSLLNTEAISRSRYSAEPYPHFLGAGLLREEAIPALRRDFPAITKPGYLTVEDVDLNGSFRTLIDQLESPELTEVLSQRFGIDLHPYPRLTTIMKQSQPKYGSIHTDGPSKVMTMLVYMNDEWQQGEGGRLRALYNGTDYEPYACEVPPLMGTVFGFLRTDNSWHGHRPFSGERRVVQIAWIKDQKELERKRRRNSFAQILKGVFGR